MKTIGITSTIPLEIPLAAGWRVLDLNNLFLAHPARGELIEYAESRGFPHNTCTWIKGIYAAVKREGIKTIIAVTAGDCSNTHALVEVLRDEGVKCIPFAYPYGRNEQSLRRQLEGLMRVFAVSPRQVRRMKQRLDAIRRLVWRIDELSWRENKVSGWENHFFQVSCSDMGGDSAGFASRVSDFLASARQRSPLPQKIRLAYLGVPPIFPQIYDYLESRGARVIFNEIQRQFSMPEAGSELLEQYRNYTYPYDIFLRLEDVKKQLRLRRIDGVIHYTQSFCFRQIEDIIIRKHLSHPILTLEGDSPQGLDMRTRLRLESFLESLQARKTESALGHNDG